MSRVEQGTSQAPDLDLQGSSSLPPDFKNPVPHVPSLSFLSIHHPRTSARLETTTRKSSLYIRFTAQTTLRLQKPTSKNNESQARLRAQGAYPRSHRRGAGRWDLRRRHLWWRWPRAPRERHRGDDLCVHRDFHPRRARLLVHRRLGRPQRHGDFVGRPHL